MARAWLGWCEMWRTHNWLVPTVDRIREIEVGDLVRHYDLRLARDDLDMVLALIDGLLVEMCWPRRPMSRPAAVRLLRRSVDRILPSVNDENAA